MKKRIFCLFFVLTGLGVSYSQVCIDTVTNGLSILSKTIFNGSDCLFTVNFCVRKTSEAANVIDYAVYTTDQYMIDSLDVSGYPVGSVICKTFTFIADCSSTASFVAVGRDINKSICGAVATLILLPIRLLSFDGELEKSGEIQLKWQTASESNSSHFIVQQSQDGKSFLDIVKIKASGESIALNSYSYEIKPNPGSVASLIYYFRLKMVDKDDNFTYSQIIKVAKKGSHKFSIFPNPSSNLLNIDKSDLERENLKMINLQGQEVLLIWLNESLLDLSQMLPGIYFVKYQSEVIRFVKE